ncbi:hypothetical protein B0H14DRAFT_3439234 [Mycena olivaceomarginata]|nr:hypothetical protein B0H14DRAFT_3439234 [Mycena olivaceomarginata]
MRRGITFSPAGEGDRQEDHQDKNEGNDVDDQYPPPPLPNPLNEKEYPSPRRLDLPICSTKSTTSQLRHHPHLLSAAALLEDVAAVKHIKSHSRRALRGQLDVRRHKGKKTGEYSSKKPRTLTELIAMGLSIG